MITLCAHTHIPSIPQVKNVVQRGEAAHTPSAFSVFVSAQIISVNLTQDQKKPWKKCSLTNMETPQVSSSVWPLSGLLVWFLLLLFHSRHKHKGDVSRVSTMLFAESHSIAREANLLSGATRSKFSISFSSIKPVMCFGQELEISKPRPFRLMNENLQ